MEVNTLVTHKRYNKLGIGCVANVVSNGKKLKVNFGTENVLVCQPKTLKEVDVSECKTISFQDLRRKTLTNTVDLEYVIIGNEVKQWVGIGFVSCGVVTEDDLKKYFRVV